MVIKNINFTDFALDPKLGIKDYSVIHHKNGIPLKFFLVDKDVTNQIKSGRTPSKFNEEYWNGDYDFLTMQDVDTSIFKVGETSEKITDVAIEEEKTLYQAPENALIVSNAMTVGLAFTTDKPIFINQNVFHINIDETKINKVFAKWYFNLIFRPNFESVFVSKYFSKDEYGFLKMPNIKIEQQNKVCLKIIDIENEIIKLNDNKKKTQAIIDKIFSKILNFDYSKYWQDKTSSITSISLNDMSCHKDIRMGLGVIKANINYRDYINRQFDYIQIGKILSLEYGTGLPENKREGGDFPVIGANGIVGYHNDYILEGTQIIIGRKGSAGEVNLIYDNCFPIDTTFYVNFKISDIYIKYFYYLLKFMRLSQLTLFKGVPGLNRFDVYDVYIPCLNKTEQNEIVSKIDKELLVQDKINEQIKGKREDIKKLIEESIK